MTSPNYNYEFQAGGSLAANAPTYIQRAADEALYRAVKAGKFAYVFNCRQMGKSSLRVQTENRLKAEGICSAAIDLSTLGVEEVSAAQWYRSLIGELNRCLDLLHAQEVDAWLEKQVEVTPVYRLHRFIEDVLLVQISDQRIVIFIDEIDSVLSLSFPAGDFFALIRACYNRQVDNPDYRRLTFVLLGVTTPSQLIRDSSRTPFNIGQAIELAPLALERATALAEGLLGWVSEPEQVLAEIFYWTGGQPYLTQCLCALVQEQAMEADSLPLVGRGEAAVAVAELVQRQLIHNWKTSDEQAHFKTMRDRFLRREHLANRLLGMYEQILTQGSIPKENSAPHMELRLSGLVASFNGDLRVFNPTYAQVFDLGWVQTTLESLRPYAETFQAWVTSGYTDESRLLRGQALTEAEAWAKGKGLSDLDGRYLRESQAAENRDVKSALARSEALKQEIEERQQDLKKFNQEAEIQIQKQNRRIRNRSRIAVFTLVASLIGGACASGAIVLFNNARDALDTVREVSQLERAGVAAREKFSHNETEALWDAFKAAHRANEIYQHKGSNFLAASPILALQTNLNQIRETQLIGHKGPIDKVDISSDGQRVITVGRDEKALLWNLQGEQLLVIGDGDSNITYAEFGSDGNTIITSSSDGTARLWNFRGIQIALFEGHEGVVFEARLSPDGQWVVTAGSDGTARLWDSKGNQIFSISGNGDPALKAIFSPDSQNFLTVSRDSVKLWDLSGEQIAFMSGHQDWIHEVTFSPDGNLVATSSEDGTARVWDLQGNQITTIENQQQPLNSIAFSPDGELIATSGDNGISKILSVKEESITLIDGYERGKWVYKSVFSPDGKRVATGGWEGTLRLWDLQGNEIAAMEGHQGTIWHIKFSSDGNKIVTAGSNGIARLWELERKNTTLKQPDDSNFLMSKNPDIAILFDC